MTTPTTPTTPDDDDARTALARLRVQARTVYLAEIERQAASMLDADPDVDEDGAVDESAEWADGIDPWLVLTASDPGNVRRALRAGRAVDGPDGGRAVARSAYAGDLRDAIRRHRLPFDKFRATGRDVKDLGAAIGEDMLAGCPGRLYLDALWIEDLGDTGASGGRWHVLLGRDEHTGDLEAMERVLWQFALEEGCVLPKPAEPATPDDTAALVAELREALAGWIAVAGTNGAYIDEFKDWAVGVLRGCKRVPAEVTREAIKRLAARP